MEKETKLLVFKLFTGEHVTKGHGKGREQFNLKEHIEGKYYGMILNSGYWGNISLEQIDKTANKNKKQIENVLLIYLQEFNDTTNIVAIAENTTVYRKRVTNDDILNFRIHKFNYNGKNYEEKVGYHTVTEKENMHILNERYIPLDITKNCRQAFRCQRAYLPGNKYAELKKQILNKTYNYLTNNEEDLQFNQIIRSEIQSKINSNTEALSICDTPNGKQINKKPWVSKKALMKANFMCEFNNAHKTFLTDSGYQYMEGHHLIRCTVKISEEIWDKYRRNIDTEANIVSLCPNCHSRIHYGNKNEKMEVIVALYNKKHEELSKNGIPLTLDELKNIYEIY